MFSYCAPLCDRKLEAEGRALQTSEASLPYQGKRNTGTEAVGRGERSEAETKVRPQAEPESKRAKREFVQCSIYNSPSLYLNKSAEFLALVLLNLETVRSSVTRY